MANIILKLIPNKWDEKHFFSFIKKSDRCPKDQHFLAHNNAKREIVAGDFWECFIWSRRELNDKILYKVVPHRKVDPEKMREERARVAEFNAILSAMEKFVGDDFEKIVYLPDNRPFLLAKTKNRTALAAKYPSFIFMEEPDRLLAQPPKPQKPKGFKRPIGGRGSGKPRVGFDSGQPKKTSLNPLYKRFKTR